MGVMIGSELQSMMAANFASMGPGLVTIPGGTFMMGATAGSAGHQATISTFQMGINTVTNAEYARHIAALGVNRYAIIAQCPVTHAHKLLAIGSDEAEVRNEVDKLPLSEIYPEMGEIATIGAARVHVDMLKSAMDSLTVVKIEDYNPSEGFDRPNQPANVNWHEAMVYALLHGVTLPTEWQWEYAARVVTGQKGLREYATPSGTLNHDEVHYGAVATIDVDDPRYSALPNGLRHITGNVWEWMANWHGQYPEEPVVDTMGPTDGERRSLRGGSWFSNDPRSLRAAYRYGSHPNERGDFVGFRVAAPQGSPK